MALITITLDCTRQPYYVDQFGTPAHCGDTIQWKAINGRFSITIRDATQFFSAAVPPPLNNIEKIIVDSAGNPYSKVYTIQNNLTTGTAKEYEVYCITNSDQADAPPRIIITPAA